MNILTNRLNINFNIDAIKKDFVFIRLARQSKDKWRGRRELDHLFGQDFNAAAVMFQYGDFAYAMFKRPIDVYQLLSRIRANEEFQNNAVIEVAPLAIRDLKKDCICEAWLAQILLNYLSASTSRFPQYQYCNLTGSLLLVIEFKGKNKDGLNVAKITITSDFLLKVQIVSYRSKFSILSELNKVKKNGDNKRIIELQNALKKPNYRFEPENNSLRIHLDSDSEIDSKSIYIECGIKGKKASIQFLEFSSSNAFYKSSAGILQYVKTSIKKHLSTYMTVDFCYREIDSKKEINNILMDKPKNIHKFLTGQQIHIVDRVNNEESLERITELKKMLLSNYITDENLINVGEQDKAEALNFRIIHDKSYYKEKDIEDEYKASDNNTQRQNITIESNKEISMAVVKTTMKELIIKRDIQEERFSLFPWSSKLNPQGIWTFATCDEDSSHVVFMKIDPNGSFKFFNDDSNKFYLEKFEDYRQFIIDSKTGKKIRNLEGLVISETGDINQIFLTDEISLPDISEIEKILHEIETELPKDKQTGNDLAIIVEEFVKQLYGIESEFNIEKFNSFSNALMERGNNPISKSELYSLIRQYLGTNSKNKDTYIGNTKEATRFRDYLLDKHEIRLKFPQDNQSKDDLFDAYLNIKYFGKTEKEAYYCVGDRRENVQTSFKDACHLRQIVAVNGSKLIFQELLPTMDVDFVRTGQSTVIPFPFKYIREYLKLDVGK
jgi:hypothetical protein